MFNACRSPVEIRGTVAALRREDSSTDRAVGVEGPLSLLLAVLDAL